MATVPRTGMAPVWCSIMEAAAHLGIGRSGIYRLIGANRINTRKLGQRVLIEIASLDALLAEAPTVDEAHRQGSSAFGIAKQMSSSRVAA